MQNTLRPNSPSEHSHRYICSNPLIRKLSLISEVSTDYVTYGGIASKCGTFLLMVVLGIALQMLLARFSPFAVDVDGEVIVSSFPALIGMAVALLFFIVTPFLAFFVRKTLPVTGSLYCISTGYVLASMVSLFEEYRAVAGLALVLTLAVVGVMVYLYGTGKIKVTQKMRKFLSILMFSSIAGTFLLFLCYFIPGLRPAVDFILGSPVLNTFFSVAGIGIAAMFLMVDFDTIQSAVDRRLPVQYEWYAAFGLVFSVIWLYFKILDLLLQMKNSGSSRK
ncbi:MAG: Bax inhibitor-1/YccA family protein [Eubacteriales bacterium]|nr:Bax inhibitor-1/YccA family protein [Eubacteriales bacterium]